MPKRPDNPSIESYSTVQSLPVNALPVGVSGRTISEQLNRILTSATFVNSGRLSRFLRFTVERATEGRADELKEYSLALSVFDKRDSFDSRFDPIVRVEAGRLRTRLKRYYETEGREDPVVIDLPKGSYVPRFASPQPAAPPIASATPSYSPNSIAVLPFADHSPQRDQEYFCDGMTEELINALTKVRELRVVAWTSALHLRGKANDLRKVADQLKVGTIVGGSVRKAGDRLRITVQLIGAADDRYLWSEIYDRELKDVFSIQEEISRAIVARLTVQIADAPDHQLVRRNTESFEAYTLYLKGRHAWNQRSEHSLKHGIDYFEQAIVNDPRYAPAYSGLADSYSLLGNLGAVPARDVKAKAMLAALKAVEIDPTLAEAHTALGHIRATYSWDWPSARAEYKTAIALNPAYATAHHWYAVTYLAPLGLLDEALREIQKAEGLDPMSVSIKRDTAVILYYARRYEQALEESRKTIRIEPAFPGGYWALGLAHEALGQHAEAVAAFRRALELAPDTPRWLGALGHAYSLSGDRVAAERILEKLGELAQTRYVQPFDFALVHLAMGDTGAAFERLEQAFKFRSYELVSMKVDPRFDPARSDPRIGRLLKRLGLEIAMDLAV
jgi:TolB-like protein/Flp pilus assembly protein TadD